MPRVLLIRHGSTDAMGRMLCGRMTGIPLNNAGKEQARILGRESARIRDLKGLYVSPLQRAQETAEPIAEAHRIAPVTDSRFAEIEYGEWTGKSLDEIKRDPRWEPYNRVRSLHAVPGGESLLAVQQRAWTGLDGVCQKHANGTVAIVTHSDVIRALLLLLLAMPLDNIMRLRVDTASISVADVPLGFPPTVLQINAAAEGCLWS